MMVKVDLQTARCIELDEEMGRLSVTCPDHWRVHVGWQGDMEARDAVKALRDLADAVEAKLG